MELHISQGSSVAPGLLPALPSPMDAHSDAELNGGTPPDAAQIIRAWRRRMGLTQEALAQALSVTFSTVSRWENGHVKPSKLAWKALEQLADERGSPLMDDPVRDGSRDG